MPGVYNISEWDPDDADSEGELSNLPEGVSWTEENGEGLTLTGISNLTIRGVTGSGEWPKIIVDPREVYVLRFVNCSDIVIESLTAGHSEGGMCGGGVFKFEESSRITVNAVAMYGSGTEGLTLRNVSDMKVTNSKIYECTEAIFSVDGGGNVAFENCLFLRNRGYRLVGVAGDGGQHLSITDCDFRDNWNDDGYGGMFFLTGEGVISISRTKFIGNKIYSLNIGSNNARFGEGCEFDNIFFDARDGTAYRFVKIGNQTWMAENLNYQTPNSYCYNNSDYACGQYGRLYRWDAAKEACPTGWRLPSKEEWNALVAAAGGGEAGKTLKSASGWNENGNGTNESGFSALPGGSRNAGGGFENVNSGNWWTATERDGNFAYYRFMGSAKNTVFENYYSKNGGYSVRCVQDDGANAESPSDGQTLIKRIPAGYRIHSIDGKNQIFRGDLNSDGADDYAVIIKEEAETDGSDAYRGVMIFFKDGIFITNGAKAISPKRPSRSATKTPNLN